jgi:hypothetical protein
MSHSSLEAVTLCREHRVILLSLPPHFRNKLQSLDRGIFGSREKFYASEGDKWIHNHPELGIPQGDIYFIFGNAPEKVVNMNIAKVSFQVTELHPFSTF